MAGFAPKLPLKLDAQQGYTLISDLKNLVKQNFLMLLLTNPGERIMDSSFGVGLKRLLFENFGSSNVVNFEQRLTNQVSKYIPYIKISNIDYGNTDQDGSLLSLKISIFIIPLGSSVNFIIQSNGQVITS